MTPTASGVTVSWGQVAGDVAGYRVYYGGVMPAAATPANQRFITLNGSYAAEGASPVVVNRSDVASLSLTELPTGFPTWVGVTAFDSAFVAAGVGGERGVHESAMNFGSRFLQAAQPSQHPLAFVSANAWPANFAPRALDVQGDLVVVVGAIAGVTTLLTYDLNALSQSFPAVAAPLSTFSFSGEPVHGFCAFPKGAPTLDNVPKRVELFGRFAFVTTGQGGIFALDLVDPRQPKVAWSSSTLGCANDFSLQWPYLWVADGQPMGTASVQDLAMYKLVPGARFDTLSAGAPTLTGSEYSDNATSNPNCTAVKFVSALGSGAPGGSVPVSLGAGHVLAVSSRDQIFTIVDTDFGSGGLSNNPSRLSSQIQFATDPGRNFIYEPPLLIAARSQFDSDGSTLETGAINLRVDDPVLGFSLPTNVLLPHPALALVASGHSLFVGQSQGRGVELVDLIGPHAARSLGSFPTSGEVRALAVRGPFLLIADSSDGLVLAQLTETETLNGDWVSDTLSLANVMARGTRLFSAPFNNATPKAIWQTDFLYPPLQQVASSSVAPEQDVFGFSLDGDLGVASSLNRNVDGAGNSLDQLCLQSFSGREVERPNNSCRDVSGGVANFNLAAVKQYGPHSLFLGGTLVSSGLSTNTVGLVSINDFGDSGIVTAIGALPLGAQNFVDATSVFNRSAFQSSASGTTWAVAVGGTTAQIDFSDPQAPTLQKTVALSAPVLGIDQLCGVELGAADGSGEQSAALVCEGLGNGSERSRLALGTTRASRVGMAKYGRYAAIVFPHERVMTVVLDGAPHIDATLPLDAPLISISVEGSSLYANCLTHACRLDLRSTP